MNKQTKQAIGIYGGTFDPVHFGHLRPALEVCETLDLKQIRFIPSCIPPHRDSPDTSVENRLLMLEKAIASEKRFVVDQLEIKRQGNSYTIDTLKSLKNSFPYQPLCLILGLDAFLKINSWYRWKEFMSFCHFVVTKRPDSQFDCIESWPFEIQNLFEKHQVTDHSVLHTLLQGKIYFMHVTQLPISSSLIRHKLKNKLSIRYLLHDKVYDIIAEKKVYS